MRTLSQAVKAATRMRALDRALNQLEGCPVGCWPETEQAKRAIAAELPILALRRFHVFHLIDALFVVDAADRYRRKV